MEVHPSFAFYIQQRSVEGEQLLPGIPNEITLDLIVPKLGWKDFHVLSSVSRCWQGAIRAKKVYETRVRANATETLIVHIHTCYGNKSDAIALYSTSEKRCYKLPPTPLLPNVSLVPGSCVALDGKVYVLGGIRDVLGDRDPASSTELSACKRKRSWATREVYVLDLAGQSGWKQCASMLETRHRFGCGVMDGKIYVFGGITNVGNVWEGLLRSEVYDTQKNAWSPIMPMPILMERNGSNYLAATVGKELLPYSCNISTLPFYNPAKNEWRLVEQFCENNRWLVFTRNEKFYGFSVYVSGIDVYDVNQHSWIMAKTNSFTTMWPEVLPLVSNVLAVEDELFLTAMGAGGPISFQCAGFDNEKKEIVWQRVPCSNSSSRNVHFKCSIQL